MSEEKSPGEVYLGDAVYASFDGYQVCLRTGDANNQVIYLEPDVLHSLYEHASRWMPHDIFGGRK